MNSIPEKDWKKLRKLKDEKLNKACGDIRQKIEAEINGSEKDNHKVYLRVWEILRTEDKKIYC